jgi:hypothetical protein
MLLVLSKLVFCSEEKDVPGDIGAAPDMILSLSFNSHSGGILKTTIKDLCSEIAAAVSGGCGNSFSGFADDDLGLGLGLDLGVDVGFGFGLAVEGALVGVVFAFFAYGWDNSLANTSALCLCLRS